jgi:hypothetical protein
MTVRGTAGGTVPDDATDVYAYVWVTDAGAIGVTSHAAEDSDDVGTDLEWHAHYLTLDGSCVIGEEDAGVPVMSGNTITLSGTTATSTSGALAAVASFDEELDLCVKKVFDSFP